MFPRLKQLKDILGLYLNRHKGMALLARIQASDLSAEDRTRLSRIMRTMLKLPEEPGQESEASDPCTPASRRRQRHSS
jgi:hypothetical protein